MSYVVFFWMDSRLSLDPQCYGNATSLPLPQSKIWKPPVTLLNGISDKSKTEYDENLVHICHPGVVLWPVGEIQSVGCEIDITYYPFDTQTCVVIYGLTNMNTDDVNLHPSRYSEPITTRQMQKDGTWDLIGTACNKQSAISRNNKVIVSS